MTIKFRAMQREATPLSDFGSLMEAMHVIIDKAGAGDNREGQYFIERKEFPQEDS